jgi:hypothetical protein
MSVQLKGRKLQIHKDTNILLFTDHNTILYKGAISRENVVK